MPVYTNSSLLLLLYYCHSHCYIYIYTNMMYQYYKLIVCINITEKDVVDASYIRRFVKVAKKHLRSLYHQMFIVLCLYLTCNSQRLHP